LFNAAVTICQDARGKSRGAILCAIRARHSRRIGRSPSRGGQGDDRRRSPREGM